MGARAAQLGAWLWNYRRADLRSDISAGVIVAVMLVPQAMAYAMLAGLPPVVGLYASTFPLVAYALFGTSRQLAVGPVAIVSLLVADACSKLANGDSAQFLGLAVTLALLVGAVQLVLGLVRAGFLVNFVSHAVVSGFTSAGAIIIGLSQLQHLLGIKLAGGHAAYAVLWEAICHLGDAHGLTVLFGFGATALLLGAKYLRVRFPMTLPVIAVATLLVWWFKLEEHGLRSVGAVPAGLPAWRVPTLAHAGDLLTPALVIVFISFMESIAVAQWIATREKYRVDASRELIGLGLANVVAAFCSGYPVTGGFSRTAVNYQSGARTPLASLISAALVLLTLLAFTPLFTHLPNAVLAAVIMVAVVGLIDFQEARHLFKIKRADGWVFLVTFAVTLGVGMDSGLICGIVLSLLLFIARSARPRISILGRIGDGHEYRDLRRYPDAVTNPAIIMLRVDASMYFANARFVEDRIRLELLRQPQARWVLLDMSGVNDIDAVAVRTFEELMQDCASQGVRFAFAGMKAPLRDIVSRAGWADKLGKAMIYPSLSHALPELVATAMEPPPAAQ